MKKPTNKEVTITMSTRRWKSLLAPDRMKHHDTEAQAIIRKALEKS